MSIEKNLYFIFTMDCERVGTESWMNDGAPSWSISEKAILGMAEVLKRKKAIGGFYSTPATAKKHRKIFIELAKEGFELGLQFHCDSFRDLKYRKHLGQYEYKKQKEILKLAKQDWEDALGMESTVFKPGYGSANDHTFPILSELGYRETSNTYAGGYDRSVGRDWRGAFPYAHHASSESRLICGNLDLYKIPVTALLPGMFSSRITLNPDMYSLRGVHSRLIRTYVQTMLEKKQPIKTVVAATHNTTDYLDKNDVRTQLMGYIIDSARETAKKYGLNFVPATLEKIHQEADKIGAF
ncbi:MAG: polysaccharide deacetylase family protein [bacterium]|nr:polysaccharide deacetylase family protein [bacterium]